MDNKDLFKDNTIGTIWLGEVINVDDPLKLGRIKIRIFGKYDELEDSVIPWAISLNLLSSGTLILPKVGEVVNVLFENGDEYVPLYFTNESINDTLKANIEDDYPLFWSLYNDNIGDKSLNIYYTDTQGLIIQKNDSIIRFNNEDDSIIINNGENSKVIHLNNSGISIGSLESSAEPAVLADTLEQLLNDFITDLGNVGGVLTPMGPTNLLSTSPQWPALVSKYQTAWREFKSQIVTID